ncbi:MAG: hypothetical protein IPG79_14400 [Saprospiraceae bacterium]|nr:hypothetical protein [Saprospiraceae bacterium]
MIYFHFCQKYKDKVTLEVDYIVKKRLNNFTQRESLRGVSGIFSYNNVYVLQTNSPLPMRTILQEMSIKADERLSSFFVQDIVAVDDLGAICGN